MTFRGSVRLDHRRAPKAVLDSLTALPRKSESAPGKAQAFPVFKYTDNGGILVPRYFYIEHLRLPDDKIIIEEEALAEQGIPWVGKLWPEQEPGAEELLHTLSKKHGAVGKAQCGSGKTVIGTYVISKLRSRKTLILTDQRNLAGQWAEHVRRHLPEATISFIMPVDAQRELQEKYGLPMRPAATTAVFDVCGDVIIAMAQTLKTMECYRPVEVSLLIVDEAHKFSAPTFSQAIFNLSFRYSLSLTATDERDDGLSWVFRGILGSATVPLFGKRMKPKVISVQITPETYIRMEDFELVICKRHARSQILDDCRTCDLKLPCEYLKRTGKTHFTAMLQVLAKDPAYNSVIVRLVKGLVERGYPVFVFSKFKDHLTQLQRDCGVEDSSLYFGGMDKDQCVKPGVTFLTYGVGKYGLDVPWKSAVVLALPISDPEQVVGRIERVHEGKKAPVIIDPFIFNGFFHWQWRKRVKYYQGAGYVSHIVRSAEAACVLLDQFDEDRAKETAKASGGKTDSPGVQN